MTTRIPLARQRQAGFSLTEAMVAITLGAVLTTGIAQLFISARQNYQVRAERAAMSENARYAVSQVARVVRLAGYHGNSANEWVTGPFGGPGGTAALSGTDDDVNGSDSLSVRFGGSADGLSPDCTGASPGASEVVINRYSLSAAAALQCEASTDEGANWTTPVILAPRVEALHIVYGEDTNADGSAEKYVVSTKVADMSDVVAVRIGFLFATANDRVSDAVDNASYALLNETVHAGATQPGDQRARRVVTTTVTLRNHF